MNISMDVGSAFPGVDGSLRKARSHQKEFDGALQVAGEKDEEEKKQSIGIGLPNQLSPEEQHRVDMLKNQAMQIASQGEDGLTASQMAQVKAIEQQVNNITGMPMSENLVETARKVAEDKKVDKNAEAQEEKAAEAADNVQKSMEELTGQEGLAGTEGLPGLDGQPGMQMLQRKSLVTSIKRLGLQSSKV